MNKVCECGCKELIVVSDKNNYPSYISKRRFIKGHNKPRLGIYKTDIKKRTYHFRARQKVDVSTCLINNQDCSGRIEVAHINQDYTDNRLDNLKTLCQTHHKILDNNYFRGFRFNDLFDYSLNYTISSAKRRYKHDWS